jgi:bifunctional oligoribonuclease and PAP phosphatase NrnA
MIDYQKLAHIISSNQRFLITTHVNPDADAIGSEIAFSNMLKLMGKDFKIINHSETPYNLRFLDNENVIEKYNPELHNNYFKSTDVLVALDFNKADRMVSMQKSFTDANKIKVCIDHHQDPEDFVDFQFIDPDYAATGHILYEFIVSTQIIKLNKEISAPIYAAIMTDTGSFRFERTTAELHRIIANLLDIGINPTEIYNQLYDESKLSKIKLLGKCLNSLELIDENQIGYMIITQNDFMELNAIESDTENFVNFILSVQDVQLGMLFIELKNGFKVSFRSKGRLPVNKLAGLFGGGGHQNASGARFRDGKMSDMIPKILSEAEKFFNNYSKG